jgi:hypothetical protein
MAKFSIAEERDDADDELLQVPEGKLLALIASIDDTSVEAKSPYLKVQFTVTDGDYKTKSAYRNYRLTRAKKDREALRQLVVAAGVKQDTDGDFDSDELIGCEVVVDVKRTRRSWKDTNGEVVKRAFAEVVTVEKLQR